MSDQRLTIYKLVPKIPPPNPPILSQSATALLHAISCYPFRGKWIVEDWAMYEMQQLPPENDSDSILALGRKLAESIRSGDVAVFCGAGISLPSGIPTVGIFMPYLLGSLGLNDDEKERIIKSKLPFEAFLEVIVGGSDPNSIFDIFKLGMPNADHVLLAKLAKAGLITTICTTNFDLLIEHAFKAVELVRDVHYRVYYREPEFADIDWRKQTIRLIKIHGSIEDRENMAVTISRVAAKVLSAQRMAVIDRLFRGGAHNTVLVMGYSCSDIFDISPQIESIRDNLKRVILIDYDQQQFAIKSLHKKPGTNPFRHFRHSQWIQCDTDKLVEVVADIFFPDQKMAPGESDVDKTAWRKCVDDWYSQIEEKGNRGRRQNILGIIFSTIAEYEIAGKYFSQSLDIARQADDKEKEGCCLGNLGGVFSKLGDYRKAEDYLKRALNIAEKFGDNPRMEEWLGNLGGIHGNLGDYNSAESYYHQALEIARVLNDKHGEERHLGNLGNVFKDLGRYQKAIDYYEKALSVAEDIGDKSGEGRHLGHLGNAYRNLGDYRQAGNYYQQALTIAEAVGDSREQELRTGNLGNVYQDLANYENAVIKHRQALAISREIGDKKGEGTHLGNLGVASYSLGRFKRAIVFFQRALIIAREIGDKRGEGWRLGYLGIVCSALGEDQKAISYFEKALTISRTIRDKRGEASWVGHLGSAYNNLGDYRKAIDYYKVARGIAAEIEDRWGEGNWLANLGGAYGNLGDFPKAIEHFEQALGIFRPLLGAGHPYVKRIENALAEART